jgi:CRP/FNR family transcriptional regulator
MPIALRDDEMLKLEEVVKKGGLAYQQDVIYRQDNDFKSLYAVRLGCIKTYRMTEDGREQVTGFYLPGEIFGMDGIGSGRYTNSSVALETSSVCELPFDELEKLSSKIPQLQHHVFRLLGNEIALDQQHITLLGKNTAEERMAALLLSLSTRFAERKQSAMRFRLPMSRADIGNYLGLTVETVSRVLGKMQKIGVLRVDNKEVEILDADRLSAQLGVE